MDGPDKIAWLERVRGGNGRGWYMSECAESEIQNALDERTPGLMVLIMVKVFHNMAEEPRGNEIPTCVYFKWVRVLSGEAVEKKPLRVDHWVKAILTDFPEETTVEDWKGWRRIPVVPEGALQKGCMLQAGDDRTSCIKKAVVVNHEWGGNENTVVKEYVGEGEVAATRLFHKGPMAIVFPPENTLDVLTEEGEADVERYLGSTNNRPALIVATIACMCRFIKKIESAGMKHGDLKLANMVVYIKYVDGRTEITVRVIDFGSFGMRGQEMREPTTTATHASPLQMGLNKTYPFALYGTDAWSIGVICIELALGKPMCQLIQEHPVAEDTSVKDLIAAIYTNPKTTVVANSCNGFVAWNVKMLLVVLPYVAREFVFTMLHHFLELPEPVVTSFCNLVPSPKPLAYKQLLEELECHTTEAKGLDGVLSSVFDPKTYVEQVIQEQVESLGAHNAIASKIQRIVAALPPVQMVELYDKLTTQTFVLTFFANIGCLCGRHKTEEEIEKVSDTDMSQRLFLWILNVA